MKYLLLVLLLVSCTTETSESKRNVYLNSMNDSNSTMFLPEIRYYKDTATNLCFAGQWLGWNSAVLTNVPCTPEVDKLVTNFHSN